MTVAEAFGDVAEVVAMLAPSKILDLRPSQAMSDRVEELVYLKKEGKISLEESFELERFLALDLFISLAKARARKLLVA